MAENHIRICVCMCMCMYVCMCVCVHVVSSELIPALYTRQGMLFGFDFKGVGTHKRPSAGSGKPIRDDYRCTDT